MLAVGFKKLRIATASVVSMAYKQFQWCDMSASRHQLSFVGQKWPEDKTFGYMHDGIIEGRAVDTMAAVDGSFYEGSSLVVSSADNGNITYTARRQYGPINTFARKLTAQSTAPEIRFFAGPEMVEDRLDKDGPPPGFDASPGKTDIRAAGQTKQRRATPVAAKVKARAKVNSFTKAKPKASTKATKATGSRHQAG